MSDWLLPSLRPAEIAAQIVHESERYRDWYFGLITDSATINPVLRVFQAAAAIGAVWIIGRIVYFIGYSKAAAKRGPGFFIQGIAAIDITSRIDAEDALRKTSALLNGVLASLPIAVARIDEHAIIRESRGHALGTLGVRDNELAGTSIFAYLVTNGAYTPASADVAVITLHTLAV